MRKLTIALLLVVVGAAPAARAQTATLTPTIANTPTPTKTKNASTNEINPLIKRAAIPRLLTRDRLERLVANNPGCIDGDCVDILLFGTRTIRLPATNATALGRTDIRKVVAIEAFVAATGAPATKTLLVEGTDYTVSRGDVTPVGDHSTETWVIHYRP